MELDDTKAQVIATKLNADGYQEAARELLRHWTNNQDSGYEKQAYILWKALENIGKRGIRKQLRELGYDMPEKDDS